MRMLGSERQGRHGGELEPPFLSQPQEAGAVEEEVCGVQMASLWLWSACCEEA